MGEWGESLANATRELFGKLGHSVGRYDGSRLGNRFYTSEPDERAAQDGDNHFGGVDFRAIERARAPDCHRSDSPCDTLHLRALHLFD